MGKLILQTKPIRVSFNMFFCAVFFAPWGVKPRETISGFVGRQAHSGSRFWMRVEDLIDSIHPHEPSHCMVTFNCEERMRVALYECDETLY